VALDWKYSAEGVDWEELSAMYRALEGEESGAKLD
jgi:hypothetical protein